MVSTVTALTTVTSLSTVESLPVVRLLRCSTVTFGNAWRFWLRSALPTQPSNFQHSAIHATMLPYPV